MAGRIPGPLGFGPLSGRIDDGTSALIPMPFPGPIGLFCFSISPLELSGANWVSRFPTSDKISDLAEPFRTNVALFLGAISEAGGRVHVNATFRPEERAWLMHYSYEIAFGRILPQNVPARVGIDINWEHPTLAQSRAAANDMRTGYKMVHPAAITSKHTAHLAIDMTISGIVGKTVANKDGKMVLIKQTSDLFPVGRSYGVIKLVSDPPHWSSDGH